MSSIPAISFSAYSVTVRNFQVGVLASLSRDVDALIQSGQVVNKPSKTEKEKETDNTPGNAELATDTADLNVPAKQIYDPAAKNADANGMAELPNVEAQGLLSQKMTGYDSKANVKTIEMKPDAPKHTLDIKS